jgi:Acetyltransferase (GNAT) domain
MALTYRMFDTFDDVDVAAWEQVRHQAGQSIFIDPRMIQGIEISMKDTCRFWYVIIDEDGVPAAIACLHTMTIDLAEFADPHLASLIRRLPGVLSRFRKLKVFSCGLPGLPGENALALASVRASPRILPLLDEVICGLAKSSGADGIFYKEFGNTDGELTAPLMGLGYSRIAAPEMYCLRPSFGSLKEYSTALRTHYRKQVNRSIRKLDRLGAGIAVLTDPQEILKAYTPEVHALYLGVVARADLKLEILPIDFFRQLTARSSGEVELIVFQFEARIVAFGWCLHAGDDYHTLYAGFDYHFNDEFDLYFNLIYAALDRALQKRSSKIYFGQTADAFKVRLGCYPEPLYVFAKGCGPIMSRMVRYGANLLVAKAPVVPAFDVFKHVPGGVSR